MKKAISKIASLYQDLSKLKARREDNRVREKIWRSRRRVRDQIQSGVWRQEDTALSNPDYSAEDDCMGNEGWGRKIWPI